MRGIAVIVVLFASNVPAQPAQPEAPKPWAAGVSDAEQETSLAIYKEGNTEFEQARFNQALTKYREAIKHWDHPAIRFNMAVSLINLEQPLEANEDLDLALKYGDAPLGPEMYAQGLTYKKLLLGQLAKLEVVSKQAGAEVTLDGKKLFTAPGETTQLVTPGNHQIVAQKPGYITETITLVLVPGKVTVKDVKLVDLKSATKMVRRWPAWQPWVVVGAGAAIALIGVPFELQSSTNYARYNDGFATDCPNGCGGPSPPPIPAKLTSISSSAHTENVAAISLFALGGATAAAGLIGVVLNQPRAVIPQEHSINVAPAASPGGASLVVSGRW